MALADAQALVQNVTAIEQNLAAVQRQGVSSDQAAAMFVNMQAATLATFKIIVQAIDAQKPKRERQARGPSRKPSVSRR